MLAQGKPLRRSNTLRIHWYAFHSYYFRRVRAPFWRACQRVAQGPICRCLRLVPRNQREKGSRKEGASPKAETLTADCFLISPRADAITQHPCQSMGEFPCLGALPAIFWAAKQRRPRQRPRRRSERCERRESPAEREWSRILPDREMSRSDRGLRNSAAAGSGY